MSEENRSSFASLLNEGMHRIQLNKPLMEASEKKIDEIYALAYLLYQKQHYQESSHYFRLLIVLRPAEIKFWKGMGACFQMQMEYEEALNCYMSCFQLNEENRTNPFYYVQIADCYFAQNKKDLGLEALDAAYNYAKRKNDNQILQHVKFMREIWI